MKNNLLFVFLITFLNVGCSYSQDCVDGINKLPMYGGVKKCPEQLLYDKEFLSTCDKTFSNRKDAAAHMIKRGWQYLYAQKPDTAMMRFNQAWLLDSLNAETYWGFADLLGIQGKFKESIPFFNRSLKLNPGNAKVWQDESTTFGNVFVQSNDKQFLDLSIHALKKAMILDPNNPIIYGQLTAAYSYFMQKDSARKYLRITDKLDQNAVDPRVRKLLTNK